MVRTRRDTPATREVFSPSLPLTTHLSIPAVAVTASYHASLLMGILAPARNVIVVGQPIGLRLLFLPLAYLFLVILVECYGMRLATRLALVGLIVFSVAVLVVIIWFALPAAPDQTVLRSFNLPLISLAVFTGFTIPTVIAIGLLGFHRIEGRPRRFLARLCLVPFIGSGMTDLVILAVYFGPTRVPHAVLVAAWAREPLHLLYCIALVPVGYVGARVTQHFERRHQAAIGASILKIAQRLQEDVHGGI